MEVLRALGAAHPEPVTRAALIDGIWDGNYLVGDPALSKEICLLRDALGDDSRSPRLIKTFPRRGYALLQPLVAVEPRKIPQRAVASAAAVVLAITLAALAVMGSNPRVPEPSDPVLVKARYLIDQGGEAARQSAEEMLRRALEHRPRQPALLAMLATVLVEGQTTDESWQEARRLALEALAQQPDQLDALLVMARAALFRDWDWQAAASYSERALRFGPQDPRPHLLRSAWLLSLARHAESLQAGQRALALDPVSPHVRGDLAWTAFVAGRHGDAEQYARALLELEPGSRLGRSILAKALIATGRNEEACVVLDGLAGGSGEASDAERDCTQRYLRRVEAQWQKASVSALRSMVLASIAGELGDVDGAFAHLADAVARRSMHVPFLAVDPDFASLHRDSRWIELLAATGYPPAVHGELLAKAR